MTSGTGQVNKYLNEYKYWCTLLTFFRLSEWQIFDFAYPFSGTSYTFIIYLKNNKQKKVKQRET